MDLHGKTHVMHNMVIIQTNGVRFSLVAGACCLIYFTYTTQTGSNQTRWTLNLNSTGAKPLCYNGSQMSEYYNGNNNHLTFAVYDGANHNLLDAYKQTWAYDDSN